MYSTNVSGSTTALLQRGVRSRQTLNLLSISTLGIFTIVSTTPSSALAFESTLEGSPAQRLVANIQVSGKNTQAQFQSNTLIATSSPVTTSGSWSPRHQQPPKIASALSKHAAQQPGTPVILEGEASFYSRDGCFGCNPLRIMANGQPLDDNALTIAVGANNKHLVGYKARITSLATGKSTDVTITDTGGFHNAQYGHRVADMTIATKQAIGITGGIGRVRVEVY